MNRRSTFTLLLIIIVALVGSAIRLPRLGLRPMHADEAVQAAIFRNLWQEGRYTYDPNEFHGPTLIYATFPAVILGGNRTFADTTKATYRVVTAVFGIGLILTFWLLSDALGRWATVCGAVLAAISPAMVFYSRYYIHETLLAFLTLAAISCAWRYLASRRLVWCAMAGACVGLMQATKETAVIAYLSAIVACGASRLSVRKYRLARYLRRDRLKEPVTPAPDLFVASESSRSRSPLEVAIVRGGPWWHYAVAGTVAIVVAVAFFSSFFTNLRGPLDGVLTYLPWLSRAQGASPHVQPWYDYIHRLVWWRAEGGPIWSEGLIVALATIGLFASFFGTRRWLAYGHAGFMRWIGIYTCVTIGVYSAIPYKTPWCLLQSLVGMTLLAGVGAAFVIGSVRRNISRAAVAAILLVLTGQLAWQAYRASFVFPAASTNPYVYSQTSFDAERLARQMGDLAEASDLHSATRVVVIWSDAYYWPLPWYLRSFQNVEFWRQLPAHPAAPLVIASPRFDSELTAQLGETHIMTDFFEIRPQVFAQLWVQTDLWEAHLRRLGRI